MFQSIFSLYFSLYSVYVQCKSFAKLTFYFYSSLSSKAGRRPSTSAVHGRDTRGHGRGGGNGGNGGSGSSGRGGRSDTGRGGSAQSSATPRDIDSEAASSPRSPQDGDEDGSEGDLTHSSEADGVGVGLDETGRGAATAGLRVFVGGNRAVKKAQPGPAMANTRVVPFKSIPLQRVYNDLYKDGFNGARVRLKQPINT